MVRFVGAQKNGRIVIGIGLTAENIRHMKTGKDVHFPIEGTGAPFVADLMVIYAETEEELADKIRPTMTPETKVVANFSEDSETEDETLENLPVTGSGVQ